MSGPKCAPLSERFWSRVVKHESGCWLFGGDRFGNKYGQISDGTGRRGGNVRVHRYSYEIHHGEIPRGKFVCHKCDVKNCVNPEHLYAGDHEDNTRDIVERKRTRKPTGIQVLPLAREGERRFNRALTSKAQEMLKAQYESGKWTQVQLSKAWRVSQGTVSAIVRGVKNMGAGGDGKKRTGHFKHKVSAEDREQIAMRYLAGGVTQKELAVEYGLDQTYISALVKRFSEREKE